MDKSKEVVYEERVPVPGRSWVMVVLLVILFGAFLYNQVLVTKQFNFVTLGLLLLVLVSQIKHLRSFLATKYQLTISELNFFQGKNLRLAVPLQNIVQLKEGTFRQLIKEEKFVTAESNRVQAIPKLGGHQEVTLMVYTIDDVTSAVFFYPSSQLRVALTNIVDKLQKGDKGVN